MDNLFLKNTRTNGFITINKTKENDDFIEALTENYHVTKNEAFSILRMTLEYTKIVNKKQ